RHVRGAAQGRDKRRHRAGAPGEPAGRSIGSRRLTRAGPFGQRRAGPGRGRRRAAPAHAAGAGGRRPARGAGRTRARRPGPGRERSRTRTPPGRGSLAAARARRSGRPAACPLPPRTPAPPRRGTHTMSPHIARALACALVLLCADGLMAAHAATRAWLDRDRIEVGETTTLNIETDQAGARMPDFAALVPDFVLSAHSSSRGTDQVNGQSRERVLFAVALKPRREGLVTVPALRVGSESTSPL